MEVPTLCHEFGKFAKESKLIHSLPAFYHILSNGKVEAVVNQIVKKLSQDPYQAIFEWWNTPTVQPAHVNAYLEGEQEGNYSGGQHRGSVLRFGGQIKWQYRGPRTNRELFLSAC